MKGTKETDESEIELILVEVKDVFPSLEYGHRLY